MATFPTRQGLNIELGGPGGGGGRKRVGADLRLFTKLVGTWSPKGAAGPPACGNSPTWSSPGWNRGVRKIKNLLWRKHALEKSTFLFQQVVQKVGEFFVRQRRGKAKQRQGNRKAIQAKGEVSLQLCAISLRAPTQVNCW